MSENTNTINQPSSMRRWGILLLMFGLSLFLWFAFRDPGSRFDLIQGANGTKTALALTSGALLGPFPTSTAPTMTPSDLPSLTPALPTATPSVTRTPTVTATFPTTATLRTREPGLLTGTSTAAPTSTRFVPTFTSRPRNTPVVPTNTPELPTLPPPPTIDVPTIEVPTLVIPTIPPIETLLP